jgi:hypothetical protein
LDQAAVERLMIDDALGALDPDVQALLADYLARAGAGDREQQQWRRVADAARKALPEDVEERLLPPFPGRRMQAWRLWRVTQIAVAAAALLVIGFDLGRGRIRQPEPAPVIAQAPAPTEPVASFGVQNFWSPQRLLASAMQARPQPAPAWHWNLQTGKPEMGVRP